MRRGIHFYRACSYLSVCFGWGTVISATEAPDIEMMKRMGIAELMNLEVTSVSKTSESAQNAAAALTVVTDEHIRRSGATTVPEALRWIPGLHVARQNSNVWAVSSRGFSSVNSEKLLVLSDTRSIYTPLFSGVLWDVQDYLMADIERIEVIRGPGAALWGSNAVNGVINITTKNAADTHGTLVETTAGTEERAIIAARYGSETKGGVHYRVFGQYSERDETLSDSESSDDWKLGHMGFRADAAPNPQTEWTVQGDIYQGRVGQLAPAVTIIGRPGPAGDLESTVAGGNILGRWRHEFSEDSDIQLRAYYDRTHRDDPSFTDDLQTIDLDLQHRFAPADNHEFIWGLNYRYTANENEGAGIFAVRPSSSEDNLFSAFVQDKVTWREAFHVTLGTKFEHNDFSGLELQPSIRAAWDITTKHTVWAAVSRAVRVPNRLERDIFIDVSDPAGDPVARLLGNDSFESEELLAYELGYRWRASDNLHCDIAVFENHYNGLSSLEFGTPFVDPSDGRTVIPISSQNLTGGRTCGVETLVSFSPVERWRLSASYSYLELSLDPSGQDLNRGKFYEGASPRHQFALGSYLSLPRGWELDAQFRHISALESLPEIPTGDGIPAYSELDVRLSWRASDQMRVSIVGQNLLHDDHLEFGTPAARGAIQRSVYVKVAWNL
jgi:iron complex outermembrane recepter protein